MTIAPANTVAESTLHQAAIVIPRVPLYGKARGQSSIAAVEGSVTLVSANDAAKMFSLERRSRDLPSRSTVTQFVLHQLADELGNYLGALNDPEMFQEKFCGFPQGSVIRREKERAPSVSIRSAADSDAPSFLRSTCN